MLMPDIGSRWIHFKGGVYKVVSHGILESSNEQLVGYVHLDDEDVPEEKVWFRTLSEWNDTVMLCAENVNRFRQELIGVESIGALMIVCERERQLTQYSWDDQDADHQANELLDCARMILEGLLGSSAEKEDYWPTERAIHIQKKYVDRPLKRLAIAGALISAEIDRLITAAINNRVPERPGEDCARCLDIARNLNNKNLVDRADLEFFIAHSKVCKICRERT